MNTVEEFRGVRGTEVRLVSIGVDVGKGYMRDNQSAT